MSHYRQFVTFPTVLRTLDNYMVASCKWHGHDPFAYFNDVLKKVTTWPANKIDDLLPANWTPPKSPAPKLDTPPDQVA